MPVLTCPKCKGNMRFPEDTPPRRVKCPSCGHVFLSSEGADPNLSAAPPAPGRPSSPSRTGSRSRYEDEDERPRRRRDEDDEDDRDPRSHRRDEDDRPRRRPRDDDGDDDRPRRRRDEDDDYDDRPRRPKPRAQAIEGQFNRASLACLLNFIGGWLHVAALALVAFVFFLDWVGVREGLRVFLVIGGLLALGYWLTSATGLGFLVSGPRDRGALGLSIATAAVAGLHLILIILIATSRTFGGFGAPPTGRAADLHWDAFVTQARALPILLFFEIGVGDVWARVSEGSLIPVLTNFFEVARMVLFLLTLRAVMLCARDSRGAKLGMQAMIGYAIGAGALVVIGVLFGLLLVATRPSQPNPGAMETTSAVFHLFFLILYLVMAGMAVGQTLVVRVIQGKIDYRR